MLVLQPEIEPTPLAVERVLTTGPPGNSHSLIFKPSGGSKENVTNRNTPKALNLGFPSGSMVKTPPASVGRRRRLDPRSGKIPHALGQLSLRTTTEHVL